MLQDGPEVLLVLIQRDMLAIRGQHCIVGAEEYSLDSVSFVELQEQKKVKYHKPHSGFLRRGEDFGEEHDGIVGIISAETH
jgi:hypothetical protein